MATLGSGLSHLAVSIEHEHDRIKKEQQDAIEAAEKARRDAEKKLQKEERRKVDWARYNEQRDDHYLLQELSDKYFDLQAQINRLEEEVRALRQENNITQMNVQRGILDYEPAPMDGTFSTGGTPTVNLNASFTGKPVNINTGDPHFAGTGATGNAESMYAEIMANQKRSKKLFGHY